jgi:ABC-type transporter MlaC component
VLFADLDANRAKYRKDISQLYKVVDTVFLPHVDVDFAAQQVLGKHWRTATPTSASDSSRRSIDRCSPPMAMRWWISPAIA